LRHGVFILYGDSIDNTDEENAGIFSLSECAIVAVSKSMQAIKQNPPVLN